MKRILGLGTVLMLIAILAIGSLSSGAYWVNQKATPDESITLAKLDVNVTGPAFAIVGAQPGVPTLPQTFSVVNDAASVQAKYKMSSILVSGNADLYNNVRIKVERQLTPGTGPWYTDATYALAYDGLLKDFAVDPATNTNTGVMQFLNTGPLNAQIWRVTLTPDAGITDLMGATATFTINVFATQSANPGW